MKDNSFVVQADASFDGWIPMWKWLDDNYIQSTYLGDGKYLIEGEEDAVLFKLAWGTF